MKNVKSNSKEGGKSLIWLWCVIAFLLVVFSWIFIGFLLPSWCTSDAGRWGIYKLGLPVWCISSKGEERGEFGDMFGAVNALFSGLAFGGVLITLVMQKHELRLQRKGIADQAREMNNQRFENSLFNMLSIHRDIFENLGFLYTENGFSSYKKGYDLFSFFCNEVPLETAGAGRNGIKNLSRICMYKNVEGICVFKSYFCHLYSIFKYIDETSLIDENEKYDYACIVRNQLSDNELLMLFYNAINDDDSKFKRLIEKYAIFNNLNVVELAEHKDLYAEGAYEYKKED